jgi:acyl CoA:acetate/3-ketoacid CoA transferase alpha subunit
VATKQITEDEAVASLSDGMTIGIGGWGSRRKPMSLVRALLRTDLKDLTVVSYGGPDVGLLCAAGKVRKLVYGFVSLDSIALEPHFRLARQSGSIPEVVEYDEGMLQWGLYAAALRLPFLPTRAGLGSDVVKNSPDLRTVTSPYADGEELLAVPALNLDAAFVHTTRVPPGLSQIQVASQPFMACLPRGHALARRRRLGLAELAGEPFAIVSRAVSPDYHERILALCAHARLQPDLRFELRHWLSVVSVVAQGLGVALVPAALRQAGLSGAVFVPLDVPPGAPPSHYDTWCLWRTDADPAGLKVFLDAVRHAAQAPLQCADTPSPRVPT